MFLCITVIEITVTEHFICKIFNDNFTNGANKPRRNALSFKVVRDKLTLCFNAHRQLKETFVDIV